MVGCLEEKFGKEACGGDGLETHEKGEKINICHFYRVKRVKTLSFRCNLFFDI